MAKKTIKGEDGKLYEVKELKPKNKWYKRWYTWTGLAAILVVAIGGTYVYHVHEENSQYANVQPVLKSSSSKSSSSTESNTDTNSASSDTTDSDSSVELEDGTELTITDSKNYKTNYGDTSYNGSDLEVTNVTVAKTKPFTYSDDDNATEHGFIVVSGKFTAGSKDQSFLDNEAVINTSDGQQIDIDYMDSKLIDDINSGATKKFSQVYMLSNISSTSQFSSLRLKMETSPQNVDDEDWHTYDFTLNLK
ncbi:hypothetical protein [Levilactobacillus brevis]|uniref:hypothetical protein n=1 Tax=Levilactobacillus brevis TaxID=1580 RepID=UPI0035A35B61